MGFPIGFVARGEGILVGLGEGLPVEGAVVWSQRIQAGTEDAKILNLKDDDGGDDGRG